MFMSKNFLAAALALAACSIQVNAHMAVAPALGIKAPEATRDKVTQPNEVCLRSFFAL